MLSVDARELFFHPLPLLFAQGQIFQLQLQVYNAGAVFLLQASFISCQLFFQLLFFLFDELLELGDNLCFSGLKLIFDFLEPGVLFPGELLLEDFLSGLEPC